MYILAIDQGTTGTTASLIDSSNLRFVDKVNREFPQILPLPGRVEHNLNDIWETVGFTVKELLSKNSVDAKKIQAIGITNQRETTCCFSRLGEPLTNAIVWQDRRTEEFCNTLRSKGLEDLIKEKTGLPIDPYFSASKMNWILSNVTGIRNKDYLFGTIDTFLVYKLTSGRSHVTDTTNASRTMLMDLKYCNWDNELLSIFGIEESRLPRICNSFHGFGETNGLSFLPDGIPITGILGDQQAALFGQTCFNPGEIKCTYGTGAFILLNTGDKPVYSKNGLLTTVAYSHGGKSLYALEGSCYIAGAAVQWLRDNLKLIKTASEIEGLAKQVTKLEEMMNVNFMPFFTGLGSPYWKSGATASIIGLTRDTRDAHIARACLEGITQSIADIIEAFKADFKDMTNEIRVDGGAVVNDLLMQIQSNFTGVSIQRPQVIETTSYGAALAASIGANLKSLDDLKSLFRIEKTFTPESMNNTYYSHKRNLWKTMIKKLYL